jgi:hypothetical protein
VHVNQFQHEDGRPVLDVILATAWSIACMAAMMV